MDKVSRIDVEVIVANLRNAENYIERALHAILNGDSKVCHDFIDQAETVLAQAKAENNAKG